MTTTVIRSKLQEVLDELSLNRASGKYINVISGNYGLHRPLIGFDDPLWRAITKTLAVQYRQIANKFRDLLELLYGPQITYTTNLIEEHPAGSTVLKVHNVGQLPDVGHVVLDKGKLVEETIRYVLIYHEANLILLESPTVFAHTGTLQDTEQLLLDAHPGDTVLDVLNASTFPTTEFPYSLVLGRGLPEEETVLLTGVNVAAGTISITAPGNHHDFPGVIPPHTYTSRPYSTASFVLLVENVAVLPPSGVLFLLGEPVEYTRINVEEQAIYLKYTLPFPVPEATLVEVLEDKSKVSLGTVQVQGAGWDVIQATPYLVELLLPYLNLVRQDPRSASYLHPAFGIYTGSVDEPAFTGDKFVNTTDITTWPKAGTVKLSSSEYVGYSAHLRETSLQIPFALKFNHPTATPIEYYSPVHTLELESGDPNAPYSFPGPYIFDPNVHAPKPGVSTQLYDSLAKPTKLALDVKAGPGPRVLEVVDASFLPAMGTFKLVVGGETFTCSARYTLHGFDSVFMSVSGAHAVGATSVTLVSMSYIPNATDFRLLLGGPNSEIVFVKSWVGNVLTLESGLQYSKSSGNTAVIVSDCVVVTQVDVNHHGQVLYEERRPTVPPGTKNPLSCVSQVDNTGAEPATPIYEAIRLVDGAGFSTSPGTAILSYGYGTTEELDYSSRSGNNLLFATPVSVKYDHYGSEEVNFSDTLSEPNFDGSDFPLRMPFDEFQPLRYLVDLVRAAGIEVALISQR